MAGSYRIRIARGDLQFEAEGDKAFVLDMLKRFDPASAPPAADRKLPGRRTPPPPGAAAKGLSPNELIHELGLRKHSEVAMAFGYYLETELKKKDFSPADINSLYYAAKIEASNTSQACINNSRRGLMMEVRGIKKGGKKRYTMTRKGREFIEQRVSRSAERRASRW